MVRLEETIDVSTPLQASFDFTSDFSRIATWDPGIEASRRVDAGPLGFGSCFDLEVLFAGRRSTMRYRITAFEPPHRVVLEGESSTVHALDTITFEATPDGTRIVYVAELTLKGLGRLVEPLLRRRLDKLGKDAVGGLERALNDQRTRGVA